MSTKPGKGPNPYSPPSSTKELSDEEYEEQKLNKQLNSI
jgi:hypothetical protein